MTSCSGLSPPATVEEPRVVLQGLPFLCLRLCRSLLQAVSHRWVYGSTGAVPSAVENGGMEKWCRALRPDRASWNQWQSLPSCAWPHSSGVIPMGYLGGSNSTLPVSELFFFCCYYILEERSPRPTHLLSGSVQPSDSTAWKAVPSLSTGKRSTWTLAAICLPIQQMEFFIYNSTAFCQRKARWQNPRQNTGAKHPWTWESCLLDLRAGGLWQAHVPQEQMFVINIWLELADQS